MKLNNYDAIVELDKAINAWTLQESGRSIDVMEHLKEGLYEQAESIKCMVEAFDLKDTKIARARLEEVFAEAYVALYFVKMKYSIAMGNDSFQTLIDEHCTFLEKQYAIEEKEENFNELEF